MQTRLLLILITIALMVPAAGSAGFLWHPGETSNDGIPDIQPPDPFSTPGLSGLTGRVRGREPLSSGPVTPPQGPVDPPPEVPEPGPALLIALGLAAFGSWRRRVA
jgi:MYXO-CTERM domain-containing protein